MFNACEYLLDRHVAAGDGDRARAHRRRPATLTYAELLDRVRPHGGRPARPRPAARAAGADVHGRLAGLRRRLSSAAMRMGAVPVPVSTMLRADGLAELLRDSRARLLASARSSPTCRGAAAAAPELRGILAPGPVPSRAGRRSSTCSPAAATATARSYATTPTIRRSGSTPRAPPALPKGADAPARLDPVVCETYGDAGARHPPGRPLPVRGQGVLRLRAGQLAAVPAVGRRGRRAGAGARPGRTRWSSGPRRVRRDAVLRRPDVLRQHAARATCPPARSAGVRLAVSRGRGAARRALPALDRAASASTSSTASG